MFKIKISGEEFSNFENFKLKLSFNAIASTFSFDALFNEENERQKTLFRPYSYRKCEIVNNEGELLLTGVILSHVFATDAIKNLTATSGYSVTGVLENSNIPVDQYPLEANGKTVKQIVESLISPFGLSIGTFNFNETAETQKTINEVIKKSTSTPTKKIREYLSEICAQRNLILTHNEKGQVVITRINANQKPIRELATGDYSKVGLKCDGQKMHSEITAIRQASKTNTNATQATVKNPFITDFHTAITPKNPFVPNVRPKVVEQKSGEDNTALNAAKNVLANEYAGIKFTVQVPKWEWIKGEMIKPNTIVTFPELPELHIYQKINVFIEEVNFSGTTSEQVSTLACVIPEVYNNETPKNFFL